MDTVSSNAVGTPLEFLHREFLNKWKSNTDCSIADTINTLQETFVREHNYHKPDQQLTSVPLLCDSNRSTLPPWSLVRFKGMIADVDMESVWCRVSYSDSGATTLFKDGLVGTEQHEIPDLVEKQRFLCIPVPGQTPWSAPASLPTQSTSSTTSQSSNRRKHPREEEMDIEGDESIKRSCIETGGGKNPITAPVVSHSSSTSSTQPPTTEDSKCYCEVGFYKVNETDWRDGMLNKVVEILGILQPKQLEETGEPVPDDELADCVFDIPPGNTRFTVHGLYVIPNTLPMGMSTCKYCCTPYPQPLPASDCEMYYHKLLQLLECAFGSDTLAAEYCLLWMTSRVHSRSPQLLLGNIPLNFIVTNNTTPRNSTIIGNPSVHNNGSSSSGKELYYNRINRLLQLLVDYHLPLRVNLQTLRNTDTTRWIPTKDYNLNCIRRSKLQIPHGCYITVCDELQSSDTLQGQERNNACALVSIIDNQSIEYDFQYSPVLINTNSPTVVFSDTDPSRLSAHSVHVLLKPTVDTTEDFEVAMHQLQNDTSLLDGLRRYIADRRMSELPVVNESDSTLQDEIDNHLKSSSFNNSIVLPQNGLHLLFTLSKQWSNTKAKESVCMEAWEQAKRMETSRVNGLGDKLQQDVAPYGMTA
eukprot:NODE_43_length_2077_cov_73.149744_g42_i0.p1 GENE.NODE_43_length_2077_cov_73.149744_g42_i0~~NODE_43_length_2077_cov_73.149744_g42_i0.p1  ORF type:complete len:642 (-),score=114.18 NODE_43_length_2077_cov_73.149744_g42_i0:106-2031(-)